MNLRNWFRRNKTTDESIKDSRQIFTLLRVIQMVLILIVLAYAICALFFSDELTKLPLIPPLPSGWVVLGSFVLGWGIGWIPSRVRRWRMKRDKDRLLKRVADLEKSLGIRKNPTTPSVFPDRDPEVSRQQRQDEDENENILAQDTSDDTATVTSESSDHSTSSE